MSDTVKVTYIICSAIMSLVYLGMAVAISMYSAESHEPWVAFFVIVFLLQSFAFSIRFGDWMKETKGD